MEAILTLKESIQHAVILQVSEKKLSWMEACDRLGIHRATLWRKLKRFEEEGASSFAHKLRGKPSNNLAAAATRRAICELFEKEYAPHGFRVAHFYQEAHESFPEPVSYPSVLRWLKSAGLVENSRKSVKHRSRRPRRKAFGELLQMDTSIHDWLDCGNKMSLISNIDDATSYVCGAYLSPSDTTLGNMKVLEDTIDLYGLFEALYVDRSPIFKVTRTGGIGRINQPTFQAPYQTQFQRALKELGVELIHAYSPQAKGRIERKFGTWQNRLIPEFRQHGIKEPDKANAYIKEIYTPKHNELFAKKPADYPNAFVPLNDVKLDYVLAEKYRFKVPNDHQISSKRAGLILKILPSAHRLSYAKAKVDVFKHTNGSVSVLYQGKPLNFEREL